jgi:hypothetical protein
MNAYLFNSSRYVSYGVWRVNRYQRRPLSGDSGPGAFGT